MGPNDQLRAIATELVAGCREGREVENLEKLYAADAVSVEAYAMPGSDTGRETKGLDGIQGKHAWWNGAFEMLETGLTPEQMVEGPYYAGDDRFSVRFQIKTKNRETGEIEEMTEFATYYVADGKIIREEFFYPM